MIDNSPYYRCPSCNSPTFTIQQTYNVKQADDALPEPKGMKYYVCAACGKRQDKKVNEVPTKTIY